MIRYEEVQKLGKQCSKAGRMVNCWLAKQRGLLENAGFFFTEKHESKEERKFWKDYQHCEDKWKEWDTKEKALWKAYIDGLDQWYTENE